MAESTSPGGQGARGQAEGYCNRRPALFHEVDRGFDYCVKLGPHGPGCIDHEHQGNGRLLAAKKLDSLRDLVFQDVELLFVEVHHRPVVLIDDGDVKKHKIGPQANNVLVLRLPILRGIPRLSEFRFVALLAGAGNRGYDY